MKKARIVRAMVLLGCTVSASLNGFAVLKKFKNEFDGLSFKKVKNINKDGTLKRPKCIPGLKPFVIKADGGKASFKFQDVGMQSDGPHRFAIDIRVKVAKKTYYVARFWYDIGGGSIMVTINESGEIVVDDSHARCTVVYQKEFSLEDRV